MPAQTLVIKNLTKAYADHIVLKDLNLSFSYGAPSAPTAYCLMAPSGAGKTTLFRILMGLEQPDSGTITGLKNKTISAVFQEDRLLTGFDAKTNLQLVTPKKYTQAELEAYFCSLLPADAFLQPVREYSGGMKRRLALLRALLAPSDLLLLDEPFSGLDQDAKKMAASLIRRLQNGRLLLIAAHAKEDAALLSATIVTLP